MADKIGARKHSSFKAVCTAPDFCRTPVGDSTPPLPYQIISDLEQSVMTVPNVKFNGRPCYVLNQSVVPTCTGDEPGSALGIRSGTVRGETKPTGASTTVKAGKKRIVRERDTCTMNNGNTTGIYVTQPAPGISGKGWRERLGDWWRQSKHEMSEALQHPWEGTKGALKDTANLVPQLGEMILKGAAGSGTGDMEWAAAMQAMTGNAEEAEKMFAAAEQARQGIDQISLPKFEMSNAAQEGGAKIATGVQLATGIGGLVKGGVKVAGKTASKMAGRKAGTGAELLEDAAKVEKGIAKDGVKVKKREMTAAEKGVFGEKKAHEYMKDKGYEKISKDPNGHGIDGVYKNPKPPPDYVIMEAKYGKSKLGKTRDGKQMSDGWINGDKTGFDRLKEAVGEAEARNIRKAMDEGRVEKVLLRVDESGKVTQRTLDSAGNIIRGP